ncbi:MAG: GNAT family N-acetyltransferase [bacterium]|jgi:RimJ/RimL family protein N-acetyltransferase
MSPNLQPDHLQNEIVILIPLKQEDFEELYSVASDPLIWEQHPNPDRYKRDVFLNYFQGAIQSNSAFLIKDAKTAHTIGCTRFYGYDPVNSSMHIGYTFFSRACWGKSFNRNTKKLMLAYAFTLVETVIFHIGSANMRSRKAIEKLGAKLIEEKLIAYHGESSTPNCIYIIRKEDWDLYDSCF